MKKMNRHILRVWPPDFEKLSTELRKFIIVTDDKKYCLKDLVFVQEYIPDPHVLDLTGNSFQARIIDYANDYVKLIGLEKGYAVISISKIFNLKIKYESKK